MTLPYRNPWTVCTKCDTSFSKVHKLPMDNIVYF